MLTGLPFLIDNSSKASILWLFNMFSFKITAEIFWGVFQEILNTVFGPFPWQQVS